MRIYICAWPRSGSKHLGRMIAAALGEEFQVGLPISRGGRQPDEHIPSVCQTHFSANHGVGENGNLFNGSTVVYNNLQDDEHIIWNVRDPRDTAISLWQLGLGSWLPDCTLAEYLESHFCAEVVNAPDFGPSMSWGRYTRGWVDATNKDGRIHAMRHERVILNREAALQLLIKRMSFLISSKDIKRAVAPEINHQRLSYDGLYNYTEAGQPTWRKYFDPDAAEILDNHCGDLMRELGYIDPENDLAWWELLVRKAVM